MRFIPIIYAIQDFNTIDIRACHLSRLDTPLPFQVAVKRQTPVTCLVRYRFETSITLIFWQSAAETVTKPITTIRITLVLQRFMKRSFIFTVKYAYWYLDISSSKMVRGDKQTGFQPSRLLHIASGENRK